MLNTCLLKSKREELSRHRCLEHIDMERALLIPPVAQMCVREKDYMELLSSMRNVADIIVSIGCFPFDNTNRYKHCSILVHNDIQKVTKVKRHLY